MLTRIAAAVLFLAVSMISTSARPTISHAARAWVADVVERIQRTTSAQAIGPRTGTRTTNLRIRVAADGAILDVAFDDPSLTRETERHLKAAVEAAAPFGSPPGDLLALDGTTDLDFPLEISGLR